jgi:CubicO group peptidase (beta-lactamase class C family)
MPWLNCAVARAISMAALASSVFAGQAVAASVCSAPAERTTAAENSVNVDELCTKLLRIAAPEANLHGVIVERAGQLQLEAYFNGTDHPGASLFGRASTFTAEDLHDVRSVTKSITAILFGIALDQGAVSSIDAPVLDYFPEYADLKSTPKSRITLAHLLGMASGLEWDESGSYIRWGNSETRMRFAGDPLRYVLDRDVVAEPGTLFNYNGGGTALLGEAISRAVRRPLEVFADEVLFKALDIRNSEWRRDRQGRVTPFGGLRLRPRDMAKIGRLVLGRGQWQGRQIVSAAWVDEMLRDRLPANGLRYGWQWWRGQVRADSARIAYVAAFGNGGQRIFLVPSLDLVVVVTAGQYNQETSWQAPLRVLSEVVQSLR